MLNEQGNYQKWLGTLPAPGTGWNPALMTGATHAKAEGIPFEQFERDVLERTPGGVEAGRVGEIERAYERCSVGPTRHKPLDKKKKIQRVKCEPQDVPPAKKDGWHYYLEANFRTCEKIVMAPGKWDAEKEKDVPQDHDHRETHTLDEWLARFEKCGGPARYWDTKEFDGGVYVSINPMRAGRSAETASAYRNALVEMDEGSLEQQMGILQQSGIPFATLTTSGVKSIHAVVRVDAADRLEYKEKVEALYQAFAAYAVGLDPGNKDAGRYTRLPGAVRHGNPQELVAVNFDAPTVDGWTAKALDDQRLAGLPEAVDAADYAATEPPAPDPVLEGIFDTGDKVLVVGSSKARKTYFILQSAIAIASGQPSLLGWTISKPRRVLVLQFEIKAAHYQRRVFNTARAMAVDAEALRGNFHVLNLRGHEVNADTLRAIARKYRPEVLIVDPLYKLLTGDENKAEDVKPTLAAFDAVTEETGATVVFLHHNPKGYAGDRQTIDRGSGSSVITRDYDAAIYLTNHKTDGLLVLETVLRNYPPQPKQTLTWAEGCFELSSEVPEEANSRNKVNGSNSVDVVDLTPRAVALVKDKPLPAGVFLLRLQSKLGLSDRKAKTLRDTLLDNGTLARTGRMGFGKTDNIGVPTMVEQQILAYGQGKNEGCE